MSIEALAESIAAEAAAEAEVLLASARAEAADRLAHAESDATAQVETALLREQAGVRADAARAVNAARLRLLTRRAAVSAERVDAAFDAAGAGLRAIAGGEDPARWHSSLVRLAAESVVLVGAGVTLRARPIDAALLQAAAPGPGVKTRVIADEDVGAGLIASSSDGAFEIDATIETRLATARLRLAARIASLVVPVVATPAPAPALPPVEPSTYAPTPVAAPTSHLSAAVVR
jgi:vacuolar-type H+-ATPase subunit E/Vma4